MQREESATILVVDDNERNLQLMMIRLKSRGYRVETSQDPRKGFDIAQRLLPDLIFLDVMMPEMDGYTLCSKLKEAEATSHIPVVMITVLTDQDSKLKGLDAGASDFLSKPVNERELFLRADNLLKVKQYHDLLKYHNERLEREVNRKTAELRNALSDLHHSNEELEQAYQRLLQGEKLASIGQLTAGVAHEINNPVGFIVSNLATLQKYVNRLLEYLALQEEVVESFPPSAEVMARLNEAGRDMKLSYIRSDIGELVSDCREGAERLLQIVHDLKSFSRKDEGELQEADINECLQSAVNIAWNEMKYVARLERELSELPFLECYPQQLNQVFVNLLVNAAHSIEKEGVIRIRTWLADDRIHIAISDTGCGIPEENLSMIFDPFFTTKEAGKGTGLGLSISHDIIKKHGGDISVHSRAGEGTTFTVTLPAKSPVRRDDSASQK